MRLTRKNEQNYAATFVMECMRDAGLSQVDLARLSGINQGRISRFLNSRMQFSAVAMVKIGNALSLDPLKIATLQAEFQIACAKREIEDISENQALTVAEGRGHTQEFE